MVLKASWFIRLFRIHDGPLTNKIDMVYINGVVFLEKLHKIVSNNFWNDVIGSVLYIFRNVRCSNINLDLSIPLWYNHKISEEKSSEWIDKGIKSANSHARLG